ncbi:flagellar hook-basal body protein [Clostridium sp. 'deep sea']|uniref:flagellar hook-basal body protein n=1 Tax=Clostridium sp. 'deep sea' TaxID=2779445 RepID=UPI0018963F16|nr:flagellar hook-basal body protein [Clostridium sp. 'deep sea']QOR35360.1 flagellar hook-basal body protein [Clostridium sp. 'deep sea']
MIQGFYSARSALLRRQKGLNVVANNMANTNTQGFKKNYASFADALYYETNKNYPNNINTTYQTGSGTYFTTITRDFTPGAIIETGRKLDLALDKEGFFAVQSEGSDELYSRGGSFTFVAGDGSSTKNIVNGLGYYLLDENGSRVEIPADVSDITVDLAGNIKYEGMSDEQKLKVVNFADPTNLEMHSFGIYKETASSGEPYENQKAKVRQGFTELSNVDTAYEMVELMKTQRIFSINSRVVQTVDEMASMANRLRK